MTSSLKATKKTGQTVKTTACIKLRNSISSIDLFGGQTWYWVHLLLKFYTSLISSCELLYKINKLISKHISQGARFSFNQISATGTNPLKISPLLYSICSTCLSVTFIMSNFPDPVQQLRIPLYVYDILKVFLFLSVAKTPLFMKFTCSSNR